uniref:hypothetical protein n=1 Tax=Candidatus Magnetaquicoccus inordinatus TaxID=2496818 RepID=UPI00187D1B28
NQAKLSFRQVWIINLLLGALYGALVTPVWLYNVRFGQLLSGLSHCPPDAVHSLLDGATYTLLAQLPALLLHLGFSEWSLNVLFSALFSALAFTATALATLAITPMPRLALLTPLLLLQLRLLPDHFYPITFPIDLSIFGIVAMFYALLTLACAVHGRLRSAAFLLGLAPAIHPTWAIACWSLLALYWFGHKPSWRGQPLWLFLLALTLFLLSFAAHLLWNKPPQLLMDPALAQELSSQWLQTLPHGHHQQMLFTSPTPIRDLLYFFLPDLTFLLLATQALRSQSFALPEPGRALLKVLILFTLLVIAWRLFHELLLAYLPAQLHLLLANRWLNLTTLFNPILLLLLLLQAGKQPENRLARFALSFLALLFIASALLRRHLPITPCFDCNLLPKSALGSALLELLLFLFLLISLLSSFKHHLPLGNNRLFPAANWALPHPPQTVVLLIILAFVGKTLLEWSPQSAFAESYYHQQQRHLPRSCQQQWPSFQSALASDPQGLIIETGVYNRSKINKTLLYSLRRCLHNFPAGGHGYNPSSLLQARRFNQQLLCADDKGGDNGRAESAACWQQRSSAEWAAIARQWQSSHLLAETAWNLPLPELAQWCGMSLYLLPR